MEFLVKVLIQDSLAETLETVACTVGEEGTLAWDTGMAKQ